MKISHKIDQMDQEEIQSLMDGNWRDILTAFPECKTRRDTEGVRNLLHRRISKLKADLT